jgi:acetyl-CoA carboxylase carboxyltransferase component
MTKKTLQTLTETFLNEEATLRQGGSPSGHERQKKLKRLTARERIAALLDDPKDFFEIGLWAAYEMYPEWGTFPAAGVVAGIGKVSQRQCMIVANDATVKAGAMLPQSVKKFLRAQRIAYECKLPLLYLVDSSGVFLPLQDEIFPDEDDFGRIFRNNSVLSAEGIPQYAAIMGSCIAGGGYLPVLCDQLLMTEGSGLYLAGPALVKAAIGQVADAEELGGVKMHSSISGTVDYHEPDDATCLAKLKKLVDLLPQDPEGILSTALPSEKPDKLYQLVGVEGNKEYDMHELLNAIVDKDSFQEYKAEFGKTLITAYAKVGGYPVGIVANQRMRTQTAKGEVEIGGVLYSDSADKAARFVLDCNQINVPILFFQDVFGFMVGKDAEQSGIIRSGAKLVNAVSNSIVPKITIIVGNSFGAGNYALCGKAYDPQFILAWPNAKYAVMGADQATGTLEQIQSKSDRKTDVHAAYEKQMDIRYGAARGWVDAIIAPHTTRDLLTTLLELVRRRPTRPVRFHTGVIQT